MFTGIIREVGRIESVSRLGRSLRLALSAPRLAPELALGDSVAVDGVCLTVDKCLGTGFEADIMPETYSRTTLASASRGMPVNLEPAIKPGDRFGGHFVLGHVDGTGRIVMKRRVGNAVVLRIQACAEVLAYVVLKGSVAVDGVSLTVSAVSTSNGVQEGHFEVSIIPHTLANTNLSKKRVFDPVNLETDIIGKYVERFMRVREKREIAGQSGQDVSSGLTLDVLRDGGFL